jgi:asparagine synthase (glutamine-hydrolysing)
MCGIAGGFNYGLRVAPIDRRIVADLNEWQRRRGPDGDGIWSSPDAAVVLGHRRLSVIDTGTRGAQPMTDGSGRWTVTFNGEIYNYKELRAELEQVGCRFHTNSDTEVLINVIARWGETGLLRLRGMYAFALWDSVREELWLARDPYGIKPLYFAARGDQLWFASQARALAACALLDSRPDTTAAVGFYLWGYVPEPFCWWTNVRPLPAGHVLRVRRGDPLPEPREFASIQYSYINQPVPPLGAAELHEVLLDSVRHHLVADVPVGLFLSGGVDSAVLASLVVELGAPLRTITLAFDEYLGTRDDEAPLAEETARSLRTEHTTVRVSRDGFEERLSAFLAAMDQPSTDGLNTFLISDAAASQGLKVALSGLGGDELFGGYPSFRQIPNLLAFTRYAPAFEKVGVPLVRQLNKVRPHNMPSKWIGVLSHSGSLPRAYLLRRALHLEVELEDMFDHPTLSEALERLATPRALTGAVGALIDADASNYAQISALESGWYMRNQLLRDTDWASMAHGVEVRVPFVDLAVLRRIGPAIASSAPPTKATLATCALRLPESLTGRAKTGFTTPVNQWIRQATGIPARGLRGWAAYLGQSFSMAARSPGALTVSSLPGSSIVSVL